MSKVLIAGFMHETNTFSGLATRMDDYQSRAFYQGHDVVRQLKGTASEIAGFIDAAEKYKWDISTPVFANATPSGKVERLVFDSVLNLIIDCLRAEGPFDAVLLALHGAMVTEHLDDGEGELLSLIRKTVGPNVPIAVTLDLHANVSQRMADHANIMIAYKTYPHIDQYETAITACELIHKTLSGDINPKLSFARPAMMDGCDHGRTTGPGPMIDILNHANRISATDHVHHISVLAGFPWSDTAITGPSVIVTGDKATPEPEAAAKKMCDVIWDKRFETTLRTVDAKTAMDLIRQTPSPENPIILADFADNPGGGGYGDATGLLRAMIDANIQNAAFATLYDPKTVQICIQSGLGSEVVVALGGRINEKFGKPVAVTGTIKAVTDGKFRMEGPMSKGTTVDMGPTVNLKVGGIEIIITSRRYQVYDQMFFKHARIDLKTKSVIAVKSAQHFRAAFQPISSEILIVDAGGLTSRNFDALDFKLLKRPAFPLDL